MLDKSTFLTPSGAAFSRCKRYRYLLWRRWSDAPAINFCMLNPSTADEFHNDPTVERCERRARAGDYGALIVTNVFAFRATDPTNLKVVADPVGPDNDQALLLAAKASVAVVCAWSNHGRLAQRSFAALTILRCSDVPLWALRIAKTGEPMHPLYLPYEIEMVSL